MRSILFITSFILFGIFAKAQNCGNVTSFTVNAVNNNNGTSTYNFSVTIEATSGGSKSVNLTITCQNNTFISNQCEESLSTTRVVNYGPFTVNTCTSEVLLVWTGHTNANCGGTTCNPLQSFSPLPVELTSFRVLKQNAQAALEWTTASEFNNEKFIVERSENAVDYIAISEVMGHGTSSETQEYHFVDENPLPGLNYYRLKQMDFDGNFVYSEMKTVDFEDMDDIAVFPTLVSETMHIEIPADNTEEGIQISIFNLQGGLLFSTKEKGSHLYDVPLTNLPNGHYLAQVQCGRLSKQAFIFKH